MSQTFSQIARPTARNALTTYSRRLRDDRSWLWGLYILMVAELRLRDYILTIQTIAVGFALIGLAQALRVLLALMALQH